MWVVTTHASVWHVVAVPGARECWPVLTEHLRVACRRGAPAEARSVTAGEQQARCLSFCPPPWPPGTSALGPSPSWGWTCVARALKHGPCRAGWPCQSQACGPGAGLAASAGRAASSGVASLCMSNSVLPCALAVAGAELLCSLSPGMPCILGCSVFFGDNAMRQLVINGVMGCRV